MLYGNINCGCSDCGDCEDLIFTSPDDSILIEKDGCAFEFTLDGAITNTPITPVDTDTIDLTVSGVNNHTIQADLKISEDAGNNILVHADGLYVGGNAIYTDANARAAISALSPLVYNNISGVMSIPAATSIANGYLSSADWSIFDNKISGGVSLGSFDVFTGVLAKIMQFRGLVAGSNISLSVVGNDIEIASSGGTEVDTLATVVARGGTVNLPITIQGLNISGVPTTGTLADDILVRTVAGQVRIIPTSSFLTAEVDTLADVTGRGAISPDDVEFNSVTTVVDAIIGGDAQIAGDAIVTGNVIATGDVAGIKADFSSLTLGYRIIAIDDDIDDTDCVLLVTTAGGNVILDADPVALDGKLLIVKKTSTDDNNVIISPDSGTIDGLSSYTFRAFNECIVFQSDGANFNIIGHRDSVSTAQYYMTGNATGTTFGDTVTFVKVAGTTVPVSAIVRNFDLSTTNRAEYNGEQTKLFKVVGHADMTGSNSQSISFRLAINGVDLPESQVKITTASGGGLYQNAGFESIIELGVGDYVELFVRNNTSTNTLIVTDLNFVIENIER